MIQSDNYGGGGLKPAMQHLPVVGDGELGGGGRGGKGNLAALYLAWGCHGSPRLQVRITASGRTV